MKYSSSICFVDSILPIEINNGQIFKHDNLQIIFGDYNEILSQIHHLAMAIHPNTFPY